MSSLYQLDITENLSRYNDWIEALLRPHLSGTILEVGAGTGAITQRLAKWGKVVAVEPDEGLADIMRRKFGKSVEVHTGTIESLPRKLIPRGGFDVSVSSNVLEHIEDDVGALSTIASQMRPGGTKCLFVPGSSWAYNHLDRSFGHHRRYHPETLIRRLSLAGFHSPRACWVNRPGALAWWWRGRNIEGGTLDPALSSRFDRYVPFLRALDPFLMLPFGQSILACAQR